MQTLKLLSNPAKIFVIINEIMEKANMHTKLGYETKAAIGNNVSYFQVIATVKKEIDKSVNLGIEAFGSDLVTKIIKF